MYPEHIFLYHESIVWIFDLILLCMRMIIININWSLSHHRWSLTKTRSISLKIEIFLNFSSLFSSSTRISLKIDEWSPKIRRSTLKIRRSTLHQSWIIDQNRSICCKILECFHKSEWINRQVKLDRSLITENNPVLFRV